jgi:hypothetical protein
VIERCSWRGPLALAAFAYIAALALVGCSAQSKTMREADTITKAVYANDYNGVTADMNSSLVSSVTRGEVGDLSDRMHKLGDYAGLTQITADDGAKKYTYIAKFSRGAMMVELRLDSDGKVAAYRVVPQQIPQ